jgi:hypothetical protein
VAGRPARVARDEEEEDSMQGNPLGAATAFKDTWDEVAELHVVPRARAGTWAVYIDAVAQSEHTSETAAESAARATQARAGGASRIVIHDRYNRTHVLT